MRLLAVILMLAGLSSCQPSARVSPEVATQRTRWEAEGWTFVEVLGDARWPTDSLEERRQGTADKLVVFATGSGIDGRDRGDIEKHFSAPGETFLEMKVGTGIADCYSIVFKKRVTP